MTTENYETQLKKYHRDPRVIAARLKYRTALNAGGQERNAWEAANIVYTQVRLELGLLDESGPSALRRMPRERLEAPGMA